VQLPFPSLPKQPGAPATGNPAGDAHTIVHSPSAASGRFNFRRSGHPGLAESAAPGPCTGEKELIQWS